MREYEEYEEYMYPETAVMKGVMKRQAAKYATERDAAAKAADEATARASSGGRGRGVHVPRA